MSGPGAWWERVGLDERGLGIGWCAWERWAPFAIPKKWLALGGEAPRCQSIKNTKNNRNSLVVQWLGLRAFTAEGPGSIPGGGTQIP